MNTEANKHYLEHLSNDKEYIHTLAKLFANVQLLKDAEFGEEFVQEYTKIYLYHFSNEEEIHMDYVRELLKLPKVKEEAEKLLDEYFVNFEAKKRLRKPGFEAAVIKRMNEIQLGK